MLKNESSFAVSFWNYYWLISLLNEIKWQHGANKTNLCTMMPKVVIPLASPSFLFCFCQIYQVWMKTLVKYAWYYWKLLLSKFFIPPWQTWLFLTTKKVGGGGRPYHMSMLLDVSDDIAILISVRWGRITASPRFLCTPVFLPNSKDLDAYEVLIPRAWATQKHPVDSCSCCESSEI